MHRRATSPLLLTIIFCACLANGFAADVQRETAMKADLTGQIDGMKKQAQVMNDMVFSFGELGFQEVETSKYLTGVLEKEGFKVERGVAGIPTAWVASWGEGKPVIALGSDIDCIPQASQKPGLGYHDPIIAGAPGHGEGHNSGEPLNLVAAIAVKKLMDANTSKEPFASGPELLKSSSERRLTTSALDCSRTLTLCSSHTSATT